MVNSKALGLNYDNMNWNSNEQSDSENEILQMSSTRMQEDSVRVRLLSVSEDDEIRETTPRDAGVPQLHFRRNNGNFTKAQEEKKSRCAVLSILIVGVMLIVIINIGLGIKLKSMKDITSVPPPTCQENEHPKVDGCDESFPWQSYRLPTTIKPVQYKIFLHPNLTQEKYVGNIDVTIKVTESTNMIVLHSKDLDLKEVKVLKNLYGKGQNPVVSQNGKYRTCEEYDFLAILLKENLLLHHQYVVQISFAGDLGKSLRGFYKSEYRTQSGMNKTLATTQFESTDARSAFPCFDEPAFKANFSLSIVRNADYIALSNMPVKETKPYEDHLELDEFETSVAMSTYLLAFIVCDFASVTETIHLLDGPVKVSVYAPKDKIATAPYALNVSCEVLGFYEKVFKVPYPLPKLDLVAIPDFEAGAMENWGLVTYREKLILWDQNSSSIFDQEHVAMVIAHELAHQWFGNLVTMKWWNDLWLNEGFASYMEFYGVDGIMPSWHRMELFYSEHTYDAMQTDESEYTHPITVPVDSRIQIEEVFDDISYSKAGCVIEMMIDYLGRDTFMNGVTDYLQSFAYRNANNSDLVKSVANRANTNQQRTNVLKMLDSWTTEPGFPILNVSLKGNEIVMSQIRYLLSVEGDEEDPSCQKPLKSPQWHIPVSYKTDSSDTVEWAFLQNKTDKFTIAGNMAGPKWVIFNVQRGGYYLINYSKDLLASLSTQLKENHSVFSVLDRSGIIFNVAKSAKAGYISYDVVFDLLLYLKSENEYLPISTATNILLDIASVLKVQYQTDAYANMKMFSHKLVRPFYTRYGWPKSNHIDSSLTHPEIKLRKLVVNLMCYVDEPDCTTKALHMFNMWKENGTLLHPDYKDIVYSTAIRLGPSTNWDFMWNKYATDLTLDAHEKQKLLSALCHTAEESKIVFLLDEAMEGKNIRHQNTRDVFALLRSTRIGGIIAWRYMRSRWSDLAEIYPIGSFATQSLLRVFNIFTDESDIATGEKFLALNNLSDIRFAKRALDHAKLNVNWIRTYQPQIEKWLNENLDKV